MKVAQLLTQSGGGPADHAADVAEALAARGIESHLISPRGPFVERLQQAGVIWHEFGTESKFDVRAVRRLARLVRTIDPDVLHGQDRRAGLFGRLVAAAQRRPCVFTLHGVEDNLTDLVPGCVQVLPRKASVTFDNLYVERALARLPRTRIITVAHAMAVYAQRHAHIPADRLRVVHNGVTPAWLEAGVAAHDRPAGEKVRGVWLAFMRPVKRPVELVRTAALVDNLRLVLVGDGPARADVERAAAETGADVELAGFQAAPAAFLVDADFFVLPSGFEACPMSILQAMACGLPIVASGTGGVPEVVRDGIDGFVVPTGDDEALRVAMQKLTDDPDLRARMGASARERVLTDFSLDRCVDKILAVYQEVLA